MARWTGDPGIGAVLEAATAWRARCLVGSTSILTNRPLWTPENLDEVRQRIADNPITGANRDFFDKLEEQLKTVSPAVIQTAAEAMWFLNLFPSAAIMKAETKREAVVRVWEWSGETAPKSPYLDDAPLRGVGHPGTAYLTHRPFEFEYLLRIVAAFKRLPAAEQTRLLSKDAPWGFMSWLDQQEGSDRRLVRNAILYFLFPDDLERNLSRDHRQQIYEALKGKLPADKRVRARNPSLADYDRAIHEIRAVLAAERGTDELDFYPAETRVATRLSSATRQRIVSRGFPAWLAIRASISRSMSEAAVTSGLPSAIMTAALAELGPEELGVTGELARQPIDGDLEVIAPLMDLRTEPLGARTHDCEMPDPAHRLDQVTLVTRAEARPQGTAHHGSILLRACSGPIGIKAAMRTTFLFRSRRNQPFVEQYA